MTIDIEAYRKDIARSKELSKLMDKYENTSIIALIVAFISLIMLSFGLVYGW